jgi:hypothetical protein
MQKILSELVQENRSSSAVLAGSGFERFEDLFATVWAGEYSADELVV